MTTDQISIVRGTRDGVSFEPKTSTANWENNSLNFPNSYLIGMNTLEDILSWYNIISRRYDKCVTFVTGFIILDWTFKAKQRQVIFIRFHHKSFNGDIGYTSTAIQFLFCSDSVTWILCALTWQSMFWTPLAHLFSDLYFLSKITLAKFINANSR